MADGQSPLELGDFGLYSDEFDTAADGITITRSDLLKASAAAVAALSLPGAARASGWAPTQPKPKRGGALRVAVRRGAAQTNLDPNSAPIVGVVSRSVYDQLAKLVNGKLELRLAESIEPNRDGTRWRVRLNRGVTFHNGKTLTADDVLFTFGRVLNKTLPSAHRTFFTDVFRYRKLDRYTVEFRLRRPDFFFVEALTRPYIVPVGTTDYSRPIGTGPWVFKSLVPDQVSDYARNPNYWLEGRPYANSLQIYVIDNAEARYNALVSRQVDAIASVTLARANSIIANSNFELHRSRSDNIKPFTMRVDKPPFTDRRVREAMKLIVDRNQIVRNGVTGVGRVANDLFGATQEYYLSDLPQRKQDIERARSLLRQAGQEDLRVKLSTTSADADLLSSATLFAEQAKKAGVTVQIENLPTGYYGSRYLQYDFGQTGWNSQSIILWWLSALVPTAPYNETHWPGGADAKQIDLARATRSEKTRREILNAVQRRQWTNGGYIIWGTLDLVDARSAKLKGLVRDSGFALGDLDFRNAWFV